jgi:hypothetical protein
MIRPMSQVSIMLSEIEDLKRERDEIKAKHTKLKILVTNMLWQYQAIDKRVLEALREELESEG